MKFPQSNALKKTFGLGEFPINRRTPYETDCLEGHQISTRVLLLEDDLSAEYPDTPSDSFLPTPSVRRTTRRHRRKSTAPAYFYPRPPQGGRPFLLPDTQALGTISIHVLREEDDGDTPADGSAAGYFYPRPPRGGRRSGCTPPGMPEHFYPRPPRGGRQRSPPLSAPCTTFLSTSSARRTTVR